MVQESLPGSFITLGCIHIKRCEAGNQIINFAVTLSGRNDPGGTTHELTP